MTNTHGGSRPATRPDDGRHNNKHGGPGRKPTKFTLEVGKKLWVVPRTPDGPLDSEMWTVTEIDRTTITLESDSGITYRIRR